MKNTILLSALALLFSNVIAQSFSRNQVYDSLKLTGQNSRVTLFDYDGDGDDDVFSYGSTNDSRIIVYHNNNGSFDSTFVFFDNNYTIKDITRIDYDLDSDFDLIVVTTSPTNEILKFENLGNGNFNLTTQANAVPSLYVNLDHADLDNDGRPDLVYSSNNPNQLRWVRNLGSGNFSATYDTIALIPGSPSAGRIVSFELADLDNDGDIDVITRYATDESAMSINDGLGNFTTTTSFPFNAGLGAFTLGDFNGDSLIDIAYIFNANPSTSELRIRWNDSANTFGTTSLYKTFSFGNGRRARALQKLDFDGDDDLDLVVGEIVGFTAANGIVFENLGSKNFNERMEGIKGALWNGNGNEIFSSDFNGDGNTDILSNSKDDRDIMIHFQENDSSFLSPIYLNHYFQQINNFQILDVNNDGNNDLITVDEEHNGKLEVAYGNGSLQFDSTRVFADNNTGWDAIGSQLLFWNNNTDYDLIYSSSNNLFLHLDFNTPNDTTILLYTSVPAGTNGWIGYPSINTPPFTDATFFVGDIDGDGDNDLVIPQAATISTNWVENTGGGNFTIHSITTAGFQRYLLTDVDGDGDLDYIGQKDNPSNNTTDYTFFRMNHATSSFASYLTLSAPRTGVHHFASGDIDGDGDEDIVMSGLMWMENDSLGNFSTPATLVSGYNTLSNIVIDDIDNDGLLDIITNVNGSSFSSQLLVPLFNQDSNIFTPLAQSLEINDGPSNINAIEVGDFNGNGFKSIVVGDNGFIYYGPTPIIFDFCINSEDTLPVNVCSGDAYTFADGTFRSSITANETYVSTFPGQAANGCDSIVTENITVLSPSITTSVTTNNDTLTSDQAGAIYQWLDCNNNFQVISGATNQTFIAPMNGDYACEITLNGCADTTSCIPVLITGITENSLFQNINFYPNPFVDELVIEATDFKSNMTLEILNIEGQKVYKSILSLSEKTVLNTADWTKGIYLIRLTNEKGVGTFKLVHQ